MYAQQDPLADRWWDAVRSDAQISSHMKTTDLHDMQYFAIHDIHWNINCIHIYIGVGKFSSKFQQNNIGYVISTQFYLWGFTIK